MYASIHCNQPQSLQTKMTHTSARTTRIHPLPPLVANQIAAGEVIERPASVVKELLENALDAGANQIRIEIGHGGLNLIGIHDNGAGIFADDLPLAIAAHATSKIHLLDDLDHLTSMGFRGEALASIASVSKLTIRSKPPTQTHGMSLTVTEEGLSLSPVARQTGTSIEVRDLFYNAPVRRRFLKSEKNEWLAIEALIKRFALSAPHITLTVNHNDKHRFTFPAALCEKTHLLRIKKCFGSAFVEASIPIKTQHESIYLSGYITSPSLARSQNDRLWIYLNQRMVKDKLLYHAIKQAYEDLIPPGRFPACMLYLNMPPAIVDINVHPTKHEVRFHNPRMIHDFIISSLKKILHADEHTRLLAQANNAIPRHIPKPIFTSREWIPLHPQFILLKNHTSTLLIDFIQLKQHYLTTKLTALPKPLPQRSLLVRTDIPINHLQYQWFTTLQSKCALLGLCYTLTPNTLSLKTIPIDLPQLDIQSFFHAIKPINYTLDAMLHLMLLHQTIDATQIDAEEKATLLTFFDTLPHQTTMSVTLDFETCRELLRGK